MLKVAILQNEIGDFSELITNSFRKANYHVLFACPSNAFELSSESKNSVFIVSADDMKYFTKMKPDVFVAAPNIKNLSSMKPIECSSAILCGENAPEVSKYIVSDRIVTYGMSAKDTITISSAVDRLTIALQREIITLLDKTIEIQEISIPIETNPSSYLNKLMAVSCVLILSGIPFTELPDLLSKK